MAAELPHRGTNLRELVAMLRRAGGHATHVNRTGELRLSHPAVPTTQLVNGRRKDVGRRAVAWTRAALLAASAQGEVEEAPRRYKRPQAYRKSREQ